MINSAIIHPELAAHIKTYGIEDLPPILDFECRECGHIWIQIFIEGVTDV